MHEYISQHIYTLLSRQTQWAKACLLVQYIAEERTNTHPISRTRFIISHASKKVNTFCKKILIFLYQSLTRLQQICNIILTIQRHCLLQ
jgi:hypothetical protein